MNRNAGSTPPGVKQPQQAIPRRVASRQRAGRVAELVGDRSLGLSPVSGWGTPEKRRDERVEAHLSRRVGRVSGGPVYDFSRVGDGRCRLVVNHALGIALVPFRVVEGEPADSVLNVEEVLELEGDRLGAAHKHQVIGHLRRIDRTRGDSVRFQPVFERLPHGVFQDLAAAGRDLAVAVAVGEKRFDRPADVIRCVPSEDDAPTGTGHVGWVDAPGESEERAKQYAAEVPQPASLVAVRRFAAGRGRGPGRRKWIDEIPPRHPIDPI